jgi:glycosyltransferase involved in cell wall biosynthesis
MPQRRHEQITMLLENNPYPEDVRVRAEAVSLAAAGHRVTVFAPRAPGQPRRERIEGVEVVRFPGFDGGRHGPLGYLVEYLLAGLALYLAALWRLVRGATVLHIHNPPDLFAGAGAAFRAAGRKVIFDHHDLFAETVEAKFGPGLAARGAALAERLTYATSDLVIATNESYADLAVGRGGKPRDAVAVVRNAPPAAWTTLAREPRGGVLERVEIAYLGTVSTQDGVEGLAPVLAALCAEPYGLDPRLTIIGDGDARPLVEQALREHGVADRATFTGWVALEDVPALLQMADVCVDPAPATDVNDRSTMMKVAEYLALGKPVVAYALLETQRTADGAAVLVTPGDVPAFSEAIARLAREPELRTRMAAAARQRAQALTWEHSEHALLEAYDRLVAL